MFISHPHQGHYYIAEPSRKGARKLLWSMMPVTPAGPDIRIPADAVPYRIRRQAYRRFHKIRNHDHASQ